MSNIWSDSFKEIREPHFDIEDPYTSIEEKKNYNEKNKSNKSNDGDLANNYPPYDKVTRGDVIAGALGQDQMGGKRKKITKEEYTPKVKSNDKQIGVKPGIKNKIEINPSSKTDTNYREEYELDESDTCSQGDKQVIEMNPEELKKSKKVIAKESVINYLQNRPNPFVNILEETEEERDARLKARRARVSALKDQGRTETSSSRTSRSKAQKQAQNTKDTADKILAGLRPSKTSSSPMGSQEPETKPKAPEANRKLKPNAKKDTLAQKADEVLKGLK